LGQEKLKVVSASASKDKNGVIHISLVNIDAKNTQEVSLDLRGFKMNAVSGRVLTSAKLQDHNTFGQPEKVKPAAYSGAVINGNLLKAKLPPFSVVMLEIR